MIARSITIAAAAALLGGCVSYVDNRQSASDAQASAMLARMLSGQSELSGEALEAKVAQVARYPLGSQENPVRASMPQGQRAYLARLRCANLKAPEFSRIGSAGMSPYGNIADAYSVRCPGSEPASTTVYMDMYHAGHAEEAAVPGFGIAGGRTESD